MIVVTWTNKSGERDFQECVDFKDVEQCINKVVLPGGAIRKSIRVHEIINSMDLNEEGILVQGKELVPECCFQMEVKS